MPFSMLGEYVQVPSIPLTESGYRNGTRDTSSCSPSPVIFWKGALTYVEFHTILRKDWNKSVVGDAKSLPRLLGAAVANIASAALGSAPSFQEDVNLRSCLTFPLASTTTGRA